MAEGIGMGNIPSLGKDTFLKLLVTQLRHQDPLNPLKNTEFVAQLAQFSALEGINNMGEELKKVTDSLLSLNNYGAANLIGKEVKAEGNRLTLKDGKAWIGYTLEGDASDVVVVIRDRNGKVVRTLEERNRSKGENFLVWDGRDEKGMPLPDGEYSFTVSATNGDEKVAASTLIKGRVEAVSFEDGVPYLLVGGSRVKVGDVYEITG